MRWPRVASKMRPKMIRRIGRTTATGTTAAARATDCGRALFSHQSCIRSTRPPRLHPLHLRRRGREDHADPRNGPGGKGSGKHLGSGKPKDDSTDENGKPVGQYNGRDWNYRDPNGKLPKLEDEGIEKGVEVKCGSKKNTQYYEYDVPVRPGDPPIGFSGGKPTNRIRIEVTGDDVHSYPVQPGQK